VNARAINSAARVILAAIEQDRVPAGIACALDAAGLLQSPETAAELAALRERVAELEAERTETRPTDEDPIAYTLTPQAAVAMDVSPQVHKLRALLAGQREQTGGGPC
jgi:hypothetical protein